MWLLAVGPTIAATATVAEHGDWTIKVAGIGENAEVQGGGPRSPARFAAPAIASKPPESCFSAAISPEPCP
jgi:hypothetical protein